MDDHCIWRARIGHWNNRGIALQKTQGSTKHKNYCHIQDLYGTSFIFWIVITLVITVRIMGKLLRLSNPRLVRMVSFICNLVILFFIVTYLIIKYFLNNIYIKKNYRPGQKPEKRERLSPAQNQQSGQKKAKKTYPPHKYFRGKRHKGQYKGQVQVPNPPRKNKGSTSQQRPAKQQKHAQKKGKDWKDYKIPKRSNKGEKNEKADAFKTMMMDFFASLMK